MPPTTISPDAPTDPAPFGYFTTVELKARWGKCGRTKLYEQVGAVDFPDAYRVGNTLLFPRHLVWAWEQGNKVSAADVVDTLDETPAPSMPAAKRPGRKAA
jgi:hypothetical protein